MDIRLIYHAVWTMKEFLPMSDGNDLEPAGGETQCDSAIGRLIFTRLGRRLSGIRQARRYARKRAGCCGGMVDAGGNVLTDGDSDIPNKGKRALSPICTVSAGSNPASSSV